MGKTDNKQIDMQNICQMIITIMERQLCPEQVMPERRLKRG